MKRFRKFLLAAAAFLVLIAGAGFLLWRSDWLAEKLRARAIDEIFRATGAHANFGKFEWDWTQGLIRIYDVTIRGTEAVIDQPFVHIEMAEVKLKVLSFVNPNVDLQGVRLVKPVVYVITYPDGTTNVPHRQRGRRPDEVIADLLKVGITRLDAEHGIFSWDHQEIPFDFHGEDLLVALTLDAKSYKGSVQGEHLSLTLPEIRELKFSASSNVTLEDNRVLFDKLHAISSGMTLEGAGELKDWLNPVLTADIKASGPIRALVAQFRLPLLTQGEAEASGQVVYRAGWKFRGHVAGSNLGTSDERVKLRGIKASAEADYAYSKTEGHRVELSKVRADSAQGTFRGTASARGEKYRIRGTVANIQLNEAQHILDPSLPAWGSLVHGPMIVDGDASGAKITARLVLIPTDGEHPLEGTVNLDYDTRAEDVHLTNTHLESKSTRVDVAGTLRNGLDVDLTTANLAELPLLNRLPVKIENGGFLTFRGLMSGTLTTPTAKGFVVAKSVSSQGELVERARAQINASPNLLKVDQLEMFRGTQSITGALDVALYHWETRPTSSLHGTISANGIDVQPYLAEALGQVKATAEVSGDLQNPKLEGDFSVSEATYQGQTLGTLSGHATYSGEQVELRNGRFALDKQPVEFSGTYVHEPADYLNGAYQGTVKVAGLSLERLPQFHSRFPLWSGRVDLDARARGRVTNRQPDFTFLDGRAVIQQAAYEGKPLGALTVHAKTEAGKLSLTANGLLRGASVTANSEWQLSGLMPGRGQFQMNGAKFDDFQELVAGSDPAPVDVRMEAIGSVRGNLRQPAQLQGSIKISQLAIVPRQAMSAAVRRDFTLRNDGPIEIAFDEKGFDIKQARLSAKDTKLNATGLVSITGAPTVNVHVTGNANLAVLSALKADLLATGASTLDLTLRGSLTQPIMAGRMELSDASFFLRDVPNGLEKVNGVVFFDRSRARLENLEAQTGGGNIHLGGFIGFGEDLSYQLQAQVDNVRVRYPEGVSTAVNASLTLAGSASRSLLSGSVTLLRAALNPRTDLGTLIAESGKATTTPTRIENEFLKNMQFDVRIDTALNAQLTTSLTQNVEAEVNLRLRGTPARPVLLGRTSFTQGEISFFGTKYIIDRGEVNFYNQTKIEPVVNLDLQTRVRGVVVTINFSGPASKLNLSYRSDPPLQSSEILALLTVGRTPNGSVASGANVQSPTFLQGASSALLGQAVAAPITGRLQRLFGVSRVRIDPQLTGLENTAQARLTVEQQVSRDITITFITNLNRTQQQIVSVEWDFSREFSALAIRDENGVFGLDFFYRKRFK